MDKQYNFYNFEASFKKFLLAENVSPITLKNYLSDLRHFLGWTILKLKVQNKKNFENLSPLEFLNQIDESLVEEYKNYLVVNSIPAKTINRRLSTLRKFFSFCISQGWLKENPAKKIQNLKLKIDSIISSFALSLEKENLDQKTIKSYLEVVQQFLSL
jgi:site-specific recombinase XerD